MPFAWLAAAPAIAQGVGGLVNSFINPPENPLLKLMTKYAKASANPDSRLFKNLAALYEEKDRAALVGGINDLLKESRRFRHSGRGNAYSAGIGINPERRDEALTNALLEQFARAKINSRLQAQQALSGAAGIASQGLYPAQNLNTAQRKNVQSGIESVGNLGDLLTQAFQYQDPVQKTEGSNAFLNTALRNSNIYTRS